MILDDDVSVHIETSIVKCSTLPHWIVWHNLTLVYCSIEIYINQNKRLFQSVLMIAYYDIVSGLEPWKTG